VAWAWKCLQEWISSRSMASSSGPYQLELTLKILWVVYPESIHTSIRNNGWTKTRLPSAGWCSRSLHNLTRTLFSSELLAFSKTLPSVPRFWSWVHRFVPLNRRAISALSSRSISMNGRGREEKKCFKVIKSVIGGTLI
jgi:hypothetical protein